MQTFKLFFKVAKKNIIPSSIFLIIFLALSILNAKTTTNNDTLTTNIPIAVFDKDNSTLSIHFIKFLEKNTKIIEIEENSNAINDALFFQKVVYVITIPNGFEKNFNTGTPVNLEVRSDPKSTNTYYMDSFVNNYFQTASMYMQSIPEKSFSSLLSSIEKDLSVNTSVSFLKTDTDSKNNTKIFFNFASYSLIPISIFIFGTFIMVLNNAEIRKRTISSPITIMNLNFQIVLSGIVISLILWTLFMIGSIVLYTDKIFTPQGLYMAMNLFTMILVSIAISYLVAIVSKDANIQAAISNTVALALAFISGAFVPQEFLADSVNSIASFTPNYWFVKNNELLGTLSIFNSETLRPIFMSYAIQFGFFIAILLVGFTISGLKRKNI